MESDQKRAFLAVVLSGAVLFLWQMFFVPKTVPVTNNPVTQVVNQSHTTSKPTDNAVQLAKSAQVVKSTNVEEFNVENTAGSFNTRVVGNDSIERIYISNITDNLGPFHFL